RRRRLTDSEQWPVASGQWSVARNPLTTGHCPLLLEEGLESLGFGRLQARVSHQQARAGIPAKNGFIIPRRTESLRLFVPAHRLPQPVIGVGQRAGHMMAKLRLGSPFADNPGIISPLVFPVQT